MVKIHIAEKDGKPVVTISAETAEDARAIMNIDTNSPPGYIEITWTPEAAEIFWN